MKPKQAYGVRLASALHYEPNHQTIKPSNHRTAVRLDAKTTSNLELARMTQDYKQTTGIVKALRDCNFLRGAPDRLVQSIAAISKALRHPKGTTVFNQGDACKGMYIVESGAVKVFKTGADGREHVLHVVMPGDCFGEAAMFLGTGYPADAQAVKDSTLILIRKEQLLSLLSREPELSLQLMAAMAGWSRRLVAKVEALTLKDAGARLAEYLLNHASSNRGVSETRLSVPKNILASQLGVSSETLSRLLTRFEAEGLIESEGRGIKLLNLREMKEIAESRQ